jgi:alanine dehydrogenase
MIIGCPKEIKLQEHRAGLVPSSVKELVQQGHSVIVETNLGEGINFSDQDYKNAGAVVKQTAAEIFAQADMIVKVKEPQASECAMLRPNQILFTYLHLAADKAMTEALVKSGCVAIAYETVTGPDGRGLPLLAPMSEVAGRLSTIMGATYLQKHLGGEGLLLCGVPGVPPAKIMILGGGVAGFNAARIAVGMGANVTILERNPDRLRFLDDYFQGNATIIYSSSDYIEKQAPEMDVIIGSVLIPGASAPKLITRETVSRMKKGAVLVDIAIDQGGCFETSRATTHAEPIYEIDGVIHYCVANMPGAVPLSSALALNNAVLPFTLELANKGWERAITDNHALSEGLNICNGKITYKNVALALDLPFEEYAKIRAA